MLGFTIIRAPSVEEDGGLSGPRQGLHPGPISGGASLAAGPCQ